MKSGPYSIGTDGSNDEGSLKKLNPIVIRLFDNSKARVLSQLFEMGASTRLAFLHAEMVI